MRYDSIQTPACASRWCEGTPVFTFRVRHGSEISFFLIDSDFSNVCVVERHCKHRDCGIARFFTDGPCVGDA
jgi:hypothetical protein